MIARHRGEHHQHGIWQPHPDDRKKPPAIPTSAGTEPTRHAAAAIVLELTGATLDTTARRTRARHRAWLKTVALLLAGVAGFAAHQLITGHPSPNPLPTTPRQWVSAYEAAAIDNPQRVCDQLFSPQLAATYAAAAHHSCTTYFTRVKATSVQVRRILQDGATAIVELHQTIEHNDWDVVLAHHDTGWRAIDLIPGRPLL